METPGRTLVKIGAKVLIPVELAWQIWNDPAHIVKWAATSDDWHTTTAVNDLKVGGRFSYRMEAKDGSMGFDFGGIYTTVVPYERIEYTIDDGRKVSILFASRDRVTEVEEHFEAENENPIEMQQAGWQAILNNFKTYAEIKSN